MDSLEKLAGSYLKAVVVKIDDTEITLRLETGQNIIWPKAKMSQELTINQEVVLELKTALEQKKERGKIARTLLEEVLGERRIEVLSPKS